MHTFLGRPRTKNEQTQRREKGLHKSDQSRRIEPPRNSFKESTSVSNAAGIRDGRCAANASGKRKRAFDEALAGM
jgi:hypothetical protein